MTIHVYLHRNGGFPDIHEKRVPVLSDGNTILQIRDEETDQIMREYDMKDVFRFDTIQEEE